MDIVVNINEPAINFSDSVTATATFAEVGLSSYDLFLEWIKTHIGFINFGFNVVKTAMEQLQQFFQGGDWGSLGSSG